jgi:alpha-L-rhamnosidase
LPEGNDARVDEPIKNADVSAYRSSRREPSLIAPNAISESEAGPRQAFFRCGAKPYVRWWWLAGPFRPADIRAQLDWAKTMGFGGVELAWLWPHWLGSSFDESTIPQWLGHEWTALVSDAKGYADEIGLGCDFTFGSCWPFGGSCVTPEHSSQSFEGSSGQTLGSTWEDRSARPLNALDHLNRDALEAYAAAMMPAFGPCLAGARSGLFCDSLELDTHHLWSPKLWDEFAARYGYRLEEFRADLDAHPDVRYDHRKFIGATMVREFYAAFTEICHRHGAFSRIQCHGSPTDLLSSYSVADVPESEAILFDPPFSRIPASSAALADKPVVSAETFTCLYGFTSPRHPEAYQFWKREQVADLKLLADAVIANGVNQIVWHGMPFKPAGENHEFYASAHVGPDAAFVDQLAGFNSYLETLCGIMQLGTTASNLAIYLPTEDAWMRDRLPPERRTPGAGYWWEMRHVSPPVETRPFQPLWISESFLKQANYEDGRLSVGSQSFGALYVDVEWLDADSLLEIERLAAAGLLVIFTRRPKQPGHHTRPDFEHSLDGLYRLTNVVEHLGQTNLRPIVTGRDLPPFWARRTPTHTYFFFAHPKAREVRYPMSYGFSHTAKPLVRRARLHSGTASTEVELIFAPHQSLLVRISTSGDVDFIDTAYQPPEPARA